MTPMGRFAVMAIALAAAAGYVDAQQVDFKATGSPLKANPADRQISAALRTVSAEKIRADIQKLVSFNTRSTLSSMEATILVSFSINLVPSGPIFSPNVGQESRMLLGPAAYVLGPQQLCLTNGCPTSASPAPPDVPGTRNTATVTASAMATPMATPTCFLVPADRFTTNQYRDKGVAQPTSSSRD
jgi:hypothetical protein